MIKWLMLVVMLVPFGVEAEESAWQPEQMQEVEYLCKVTSAQTLQRSLSLKNTPLNRIFDRIGGEEFYQIYVTDYCLAKSKRVATLFSYENFMNDPGKAEAQMAESGVIREIEEQVFDRIGVK
ncbi:MAG: hypothetical protein HQL52_16050 [Magnetococcales bacterium]|nr:hypothetical protein [Magnetococcales bacterium]